MQQAIAYTLQDMPGWGCFVVLGAWLRDWTYAFSRYFQKSLFTAYHGQKSQLLEAHLAQCVHGET